MKKIVMLLIIVMLMAASTQAFADVKAGSVSVTPFGGVYVFEGNEFDLKTTWTAGLRAGYNFTEHVSIEGVFSFVPAEVKDMVGDNGVNLYSYGGELLYHFMPESWFVPFVAVGAGEIHYDTPGDGSNMNKFYLDYGAGLKLFITENVAIRADVRHILPTNDNYNDFMGTLGITFSFGGHKKEVAVAKVEEPPPPPPVLDSDKDGVPDNLDKCPGTPLGVAVDKDGCPIDSDKDGVPDYLDKCPNTPLGVAVDKDGCPVDSDKDGVPDYLDKCPGTPLGVAVDKDGCPVDSDMDGVADYLDKCPNTPAGIAVDKDGCPVDSDKDGVPDYLDKCPNTPAGATVDKDGCMHEKVTMKLNVEFDTSKSNIKDQYYDEIKKVADFMKTYPESPAAIEGHTDNVPRQSDPEFNIKLSQARADSVRQYLIDKFEIDGSRLTAQGFGPDRPIDTNDTPEGRQKNRRVEAVIEAIQVK
jgi:OmpA-OmpF porin, OOP family